MARTVSFTTKGGKKVSFKAGHGKRAQAKAARAAFKKMGSMTTTDIYGGKRVEKVKIEHKKPKRRSRAAAPAKRKRTDGPKPGPLSIHGKEKRDFVKKHGKKALTC